MQNVQMLALVFVQTFDLDIEKRSGIHDDTGLYPDQAGQLPLEEIAQDRLFQQFGHGDRRMGVVEMKLVVTGGILLFRRKEAAAG